MSRATPAWTDADTTESGLDPAVVAIAPADQTYVITATSDSGNTFTITKNADGTTARSCVQTEPKGG